jgi:hypothetical protein
MAYSARSLVAFGETVIVGKTDGTTSESKVFQYAYATEDAPAVVEAAGYFNNARVKLSKGSIILASMTNAGTPAFKAYIVTASPSSGNVVIAAQTV